MYEVACRVDVSKTGAGVLVSVCVCAVSQPLPCIKIKMPSGAEIMQMRGVDKIATGSRANLPDMELEFGVFRSLQRWLNGRIDESPEVDGDGVYLRYCRLACRPCVQITSVGPLRVASRVSEDDILLLAVTSGALCLNDRSLEAGQMMLLNAGEPLHILQEPDSCCQMMRIPLHDVQTAAIRLGLLCRGGRYSADTVVRTFAGAGCLGFMLADVFRPSRSVYPQQVLDDFVCLFDSLLLQVWPGNLTRFYSDRQVSHPVLQQAQSHMLAQLQVNLDPDDLARCVCVSARTLYNLFRRELGMSPGEYFRCLKLEQIFQKLSRGRARSVTDIAIDYGFTNLGRFARQYRQYIGELPSETLRRGLVLPEGG
jgi:AraC-like DNA-binding protein